MDPIFVFSIAVLGMIFGLTSHVRINNIEKKLKEFDVIPKEFDSSEGLPDPLRRTGPQVGSSRLYRALKEWLSRREE